MQTYTCPSCKFCFSEADKQWDTAIAFAKCPNCPMSLRDFPVPTKPEELQPLGAAASVQPSGVTSVPRFCTSCGAPTKASARFCTKCGCALDFPVGSNRHENTPPVQQPKQQEKKLATQQSYPWGTVLTWALLAFLLGLTTARPTWKSATAIDQSVLGVFIGTAYAAITAIIVGAYKYFRRNPSQFLGSCTWTRVTAEEAKKHPLYGVRGWLALFAFGNLFGFLLEVGRINVEASKIGVSLGRFLGLDTPLVRFLGVGLAIDALSVTIILWLLLSRHQSFRQVSSCILLILWPAEAIVGSLVISPDLAYALAVNFVPYVFYCAVWVPYLQRSKRVRVTFEHSVKAGQDNVAGTSQLPSGPKTREAHTDTSTIDTTPKKSDQRVGTSKPAIIIDPPLDRQYSDDQPERRAHTTPPDASKAMSPPQPTANPIAPVSIPAEPITAAIETHEDRLYGQIAQELDTHTVDKGLWTKAYAQAGGDDQQTRVLYIKARLARLLAMEVAQRDATRRQQEQEQDEVARLAHVHSIRANLQRKIEQTEAAGKSVELKRLAAGDAGSDFLYHCGLGKWFVGDVQRTLEANPFVLDRTTLDEGSTGLHIAVQSKDKKMIEYLVEQGANIQARDSQGKTPLDMARETSQPDVVELLERFRAE